MIIDPRRFDTYSLRNSSHGDDIRAIIAAAIAGADAGNAVKKHLTLQNGSLIIDHQEYCLNNYKHIYIIGAGKACTPMIGSIDEILGDYISGGFAITKEGHFKGGESSKHPKVQIVVADHPIPDERNIAAGKQLKEFIENITPKDLIIVLLSGGGSALLMNPPPGISLADIQRTTSLLLKSGASIFEVNTIRKHLDLFKGGGLAKLLYPSTTIVLILSDVVGDHLDVIASGPTVADSTTYHDAWNILDKYQLLNKVPANVYTHLLAGYQGKIAENPTPGDRVFERVTNVIIGNIREAMNNALSVAQDLGYTIKYLSDSLQGEASIEGRRLAKDLLAHISESSHDEIPLCLLCGGETTVTIKGQGLGGRNQELALGALPTLAGLTEVVMVSLATDGGDGPTDAAGAVVTNESYARSLELGLDPDEYLLRNDSYHYFEALGDLIKSGPTLTNVNDLVFMFAF